MKKKTVTEAELLESAQAPRVTMEALQDNIVSEHYFTAYEGAMGERFSHQAGEGKEEGGVIPEALKLLTFCVLVLQNGYTVHGVSACASPENYNQDIGQRIARENAEKQIWSLMGYDLKQSLAKLAMLKETEIGEALTRMTAMAFGNEKALKLSDVDVILKHFHTADSETS